MTFGYSPVMLEHLLDEALVWALRRNGTGLGWDDIQQAKMTEEIGLAQPVEYAEAERRTIATHESGHATVAWLVGKGRKMEVLSIIKRKDALGLLSHSEEEERYTKTRSEIEALIQIAFGGMVAEELFFGETSSGVAGDLQAATVAACQMVGSLGMGSTLISAAALDMPGNIVAKVTAIDAEPRGGRAAPARRQGRGAQHARGQPPCGRGAARRPARPRRARGGRDPRRHRVGRAPWRATSRPETSVCGRSTASVRVRTRLWPPPKRGPQSCTLSPEVNPAIFAQA